MGIELKRFSGSFRDPDGFIVKTRDKIFRVINEKFESTYQTLKTDGFYKRLVDNGFCLPYVEAQESERIQLIDSFEKEVESSRVLVHTKIPNITYPYEWSFHDLKRAAIFHLKLQLFALDNDVVLKDAAAYNVQFYRNKPTFVDLLSFRPYKQGEYWDGQKQFLEQFLYPLFMYSKLHIPYHTFFRGNPNGIPVGLITKLLKWRHLVSLDVWLMCLLPNIFEKKARAMSLDSLRKLKRKPFSKHAYMYMLRRLTRFINKLELRANKSKWSTYDQNNTYSPEETQRKKDFVGTIIRKETPNLVLDVGCNSGEFAILSLASGASSAIGLDGDEDAIEKACKAAEALGLNFHPLLYDTANPSANNGWLQGERLAFEERCQPDLVLCLAFFHHLVLAQTIPPKSALAWISTLAPIGVIEFVPYEDETVQLMVAGRESDHEYPTREQFESLLQAHSIILKQETITRSGRVLYAFQTK